MHPAAILKLHQPHRHTPPPPPMLISVDEFNMSTSECITQRKLYNPNPTPKPAIVHSAIQLPLVRDWIKHFDCFKVRVSIKTTNSKQLSIHYCKSNTTAARIHCHHWRPLVCLGIIAFGAAEFCCIIASSNLKQE